MHGLPLYIRRKIIHTHQSLSDNTPHLAVELQHVELSAVMAGIAAALTLGAAVALDLKPSDFMNWQQYARFTALYPAENPAYPINH